MKRLLILFFLSKTTDNIFASYFLPVLNSVNVDQGFPFIDQLFLNLF